MAESSQSPGIQSLQATTGATAPDEGVDSAVSNSDINTHGCVNLNAEDVKDVEEDNGLEKHGKQEVEGTDKMNDNTDANSDGPKEREDDEECKLENQDGEDANDRLEGKGIKPKQPKDVDYDDKIKNDADGIKQEKVGTLDDSQCQDIEKAEEQGMEGDIMKQVEEESKKQLTESDELEKTEDADNVKGKTNNESGGDDGGDRAEKLEKKVYKGKKHSEKLNGQDGKNTSAIKKYQKGKAKKNQTGDPTAKLDVIEQLDEDKENGEPDAEGTVVGKSVKKDVKDDACQKDDMPIDEIEQENDENDAMNEGEELEGDDFGTDEETGDSDREEKESKRKLSVGKRDRECEEKKKNGRRTIQEEPSTPGTFGDRPVRERKTVVRLVEVIEKEQGEGLHIEKGRGVALKDIPSVVRELSKRKPEDLIKPLHLILFGRKGKATDFKSHILQFSGFVWPENEEKQKGKVKEKLDKFARFKLLDFCQLFGISVSKATTKKEDLIEKLLDFLIAPHPMTDVLSSEKEQHSSIKRKRPSGESLSSPIGSSNKHLKKRRTGSALKDSGDKGAVHTKDKEEMRGEEDKGSRGNSLSTGDKDSDQSGSETENKSIKNMDNENFDDTEKQEMEIEKNKSTKVSSLSKKTHPVSSGGGAKKSASKHSKAEESHDTGPKVFTRRKKDKDTPIRQASKPESRVKDLGRKLGTSKSKPHKAEKTGPSKDELKKLISVILKEVDFNTATFKDILKELGTRFKTDLTHMKEEIKTMTKEELVKIAEEEADSDEGGSSDEEEQPVSKKLRT